MFQENILYSPVKQDFIWVAEYADGTYLSEFDVKTSKGNNFREIKRNSTIRFGLVGLGNKLFYECFGGTFNIKGYIFDFAYQWNEKLYRFTGLNQMYNNIISFKNAESIANLGSGKIISYDHIIQYNFGYKKKLIFEDISFYFQVICQIPFNQPMRFEIKLVCNKEINGDFIIIKNGQKIDQFNAPLKEYTRGELNWVLR